MAKPIVALQLYTVRDEMAADYVGTLRKVAAMGYPAVQLGDYGGYSAQELKRILGDLNLKPIGSHVNLDSLEANADKEISYCLEVGTIDVVIPYLAAERRANKDGYLKLAESMNRVGARCQALGARLSYHNHAFEYEKMDGQYALDILFANTNPELVKWEPDVYWIQFGHEDPASYIRKYAGRVPLIHLKDMTDGQEPTWAEVGEGILDWPAIFSACEVAGAEAYIVEQDRCKGSSLDSSALSLGHLRDWGKL